MADGDHIEQVVERLASDAIDQRLTRLQAELQASAAAHLAELRQELVSQIAAQVRGAVGTAEHSHDSEIGDLQRRVSEAEDRARQAHARAEEAESMAARAAASVPDAGAIHARLIERSGVLNAAMATIYDAGTQADILRAMLDGMSQFSGRSALFVVRQNMLAGWQARGFDDNDSVKSISVPANEGLASRAIQDKAPVAAAASEFDSAVVASWGNPADGNAIVLPLVVRDKVPAVVYADAGSEMSSFDRGALEVLLRAASSWLEILALRKNAPHEEAYPAASAGTAQAQVAVAAPVASAAAAVTAPGAVSPTPVGTSAPAGTSEEELLKKAKRFAKLLVDEIKLYNSNKVAEGKANRDLFDRLREDIEKSKATYEKRYGSTAAASENYFHAELVRVLADGDIGILGPNYQA